MADFHTPGTPGPASAERASFGIRLVAALVDAAILFVVGLVLALTLKTTGSLLNILIGIAYYVYFEGGPDGQTLGKKAVNIRVVDYATGGEIGYAKGFIRYVGRILSAIPCLLGYFWMLWDEDKQTWHDKIATTLVVPVR
jgi:uncharacterized RDD family membrane protein YckC